MALETILSRRQMISRLPSADVIVMAQCTVAGIDTRMVKRRGGKIRGVMAIGTILCIGISRNVIEQFTHANPVVVAGVAAIDDTGMIIGSGRKSTRRMTIPAILGREWHVRIQSGAGGQTARIDTVVAGIATKGQDRRVGVIDTECRRKTVRIMATGAVGAGYRMGGHRGRLRGCVDAVGFVVA